MNIASSTANKAPNANATDDYNKIILKQGQTVRPM